MFSADNLRFFLEVARTGRAQRGRAQFGRGPHHCWPAHHRTGKDVQGRGFSTAPRGGVASDRGRCGSAAARGVGRIGRHRLQYDVRTSTAGPLTGTVRMVAPDGFGAFVVAPRLVELRRAHPHLDVELVTATEHGSLSARHFDIAVTLEQPSPRAVHVHHLAGYDLRLYAAPSTCAPRHRSPSLPI